MSDEIFDILALHASQIGSILAVMKLLEARVTALEAMLRPDEVVAADWSIKNEGK